MLKKAAETSSPEARNASLLFFGRRSRSSIWNFGGFCSKIASSHFARVFTKTLKTLIVGDQTSMAFSGRIRPRFKEEVIHMEVNQTIVHPAKRTNTRVSEKK